MIKVFISHQKKDREQSKLIADYLKSVNIDVYFDEFDRDLQQADRDNNPKGVVAAIQKGIKSSTHMLCILSPNTLYSKWVPFEVGFGYESTILASLTLKGIKNSDLPDYIKTAPIIRDISDLNQFVKQHGNDYIFENRKYSNYMSYSHPLHDVMDSKL